uniref:Tyrosine protein kinase n=2 Tax=Paenibacillus athensensis TaxID=1967502 RepID=A0A4Y8PZU5_9BACL
MGGIEGIMGTMGKVQKFVTTFQQMAPMFKVMFNSFGGKVKSTDDDDFADLPRRRKRRRGGRRRKARGSSRRRRR